MAKPWWSMFEASSGGASGGSYGYGAPDDPRRAPHTGKPRPTYRYGGQGSLIAPGVEPSIPQDWQMTQPAPQMVPGYQFVQPTAEPQPQPPLSFVEQPQQLGNFAPQFNYAAPSPLPQSDLQPNVVVPVRRPAPPRANTVKREPVYRPGDAKRLADKIEAERAAAMAAWKAGGGLSPSGQVYVTPTGRDASGAILGDSGGATQRYGKKPMGDWTSNYASPQAYRKAESTTLKQQGKFRAQPGWVANGEPIGGATVYIPNRYAKDQNGLQAYRNHQRELFLERQALLSDSPPHQQPIFQNAGRPLYGADLARARQEQQARYQARVKAGMEINRRLAAGPAGAAAPQLGRLNG